MKDSIMVGERVLWEVSLFLISRAIVDIIDVGAISGNI